MRIAKIICLTIFLALLTPLIHAGELHADEFRADQFDDLARDFWTWRAAEQPISTDDIPRLERPAG